MDVNQYPFDSILHPKKMEELFAEAFAIYESSKRHVQDEVMFYSSSAYQGYYEYHFNISYKKYITYSLEELYEEEDMLKELCQKTVGSLVLIEQKIGLGLLEYKLCCELDAELDAVYAACRRRIRSKSF